MNDMYDCTQDPFIEDENQKETDDDLTGLSEDAIRQAVITGTDWTTETIITQINKGNIILNPKFQRRDAWTKKRKSKFIESLILGLPVPALVLAENKQRRGSYIVLDGKQRLLSMRQFAALKEDNIFEQLKLTGLEVRSALNGKCLEDFRTELALYDDLSSFENQPVRTVIIKNWPNETFLYHVFLRLNTGSVSLSPQELRQALHPGPFVDFIEESSRQSPALRDILSNPKPDFRMRDAELLVRYYAFGYFLANYSGNLKSFLDDTCLKLNNSWPAEQERILQDLQEFEKAHNSIRLAFGENAYRKWVGSAYEKRFNRAIFDVMMFVFRHPSARLELEKASQRVVQIFQDLCINDRDFLSSIEQTTKSTWATSVRLSHWVEKINSSFSLNLQMPRLV